MAILLIGEREKVEIAKALELARAHPIPLSFVRVASVPDKAVVKLSDRKPGFQRPRRPEEVLIPVGYRACVSVEEQPAGLFLHLSISVERTDKTKMPSLHAAAAIADEFGVNLATAEQQGLMWLEEYDPGRLAINALKLIVPRQEGHA
jgi:hypothetical protein